MRAIVLAALLCACKAEPVRPDPPAQPKPTYQGPRLEFVTAGEGDVASLVKTESERAAKDGRRLVVYVGATWCEPCQRFHEAAVKGTLDGALPPMRFLEFDLDRDEKRLGSAGYSSEYIPLFALGGPDGRASGKQIAGSIKGPGAPDEITPRLVRMIGAAP
ncbi:MAG: thioredoxin [Polyangiales bacterium]